METKTKEIGAEKIEDLVWSYINRWSDGLEMIQTATAEIGAVMTRQVLVREKIDKVKEGGKYTDFDHYPEALVLVGNILGESAKDGAEEFDFLKRVGNLEYHTLDSFLEKTDDVLDEDKGLTEKGKVFMKKVIDQIQSITGQEAMLGDENLGDLLGIGMVE